jgi:hypothetical protein
MPSSGTQARTRRCCCPPTLTNCIARRYKIVVLDKLDYCATENNLKEISQNLNFKVRPLPQPCKSGIQAFSMPCPAQANWAPVWRNPSSMGSADL